jgi:diguanylate cyclase (GGDEF)-like protein
MTAREDTLGVFHLLIPIHDWAACESGESLTGKRRLATLTADILTLLLVNMRLRKQIDDLSVRDALTGCFNRRYLEETLGRELKSAQRAGRRLAIILMDIDHFGQFTEVYGHGASSMVLRDLGNFLKENVREVDVPCRYGADEFAVLIPDASLSACRRRAEHLQAMIRDMSLQDGHAHMRRITVSIGVAACPDQGETVCDLMEAVKAALKKAKQTGRDRISIAEE